MKTFSEYLKIGKDKIAIKYFNQPKNLSEDDTIVLLHEGLGSIEMWKDWPEKLALRSKKNIVLYSRVGMGKSSQEIIKKKSDFLEREALYYLPKIVEVYCKKEPILLGHSDGASISIIYAANEYPCKALILEAPHVIVEKITIEEIKKLKIKWKNNNLKELFKKYHDDPEKVFSSWVDVWLSQSFAKWNITGLLNKISSPILLIQGQNDQYGTLEQINLIKKYTQSFVKKIIIDNCKHSPHVEKPKLVIDYIEDFIQYI